MLMEHVVGEIPSVVNDDIVFFQHRQVPLSARTLVGVGYQVEIKGDL